MDHPSCLGSMPSAFLSFPFFFNEPLNVTAFTWGTCLFFCIYCPFYRIYMLICYFTFLKVHLVKLIVLKDGLDGSLIFSLLYCHTASQHCYLIDSCRKMCFFSLVSTCFVFILNFLSNRYLKQQRCYQVWFSAGIVLISKSISFLLFLYFILINIPFFLIALSHSSDLFISCCYTAEYR